MLICPCRSMLLDTVEQPEILFPLYQKAAIDSASSFRKKSYTLTFPLHPNLPEMVLQSTMPIPRSIARGHRKQPRNPRYVQNSKTLAYFTKPVKLPLCHNALRN